MKLWLTITSVVVLMANAEDQSKYNTGFRAGVSRDIVPSIPETTADIQYSNEVSMGEVVPQTDVIIQPEVSYSFKPRENYTVLLIDPDFPSYVAPVQRSALHWLVVNVPGNRISAGSTVVTYAPAVNYPGSGCHRFVLLVYNQEKTLHTSHENLSQYAVNRFGFSVRSFEKNNKLGSLVAANYFWTCSPRIRREFYCRAEQ